MLESLFNKVAGPLKRYSNTGAFLWIMWNFSEHLFWRRSPNGCSCIFMPQFLQNGFSNWVSFFGLIQIIENATSGTLRHYGNILFLFKLFNFELFQKFALINKYLRKRFEKCFHSKIFCAWNMTFSPHCGGKISVKVILSDL